MSRLTVTDIMSIPPDGPCEDWPEARVREALGGDSCLIADLPDRLLDIGSINARWLMPRILANVSCLTAVLWACDCVCHVVDFDDDARSDISAAVDTVRRWCSGRATGDEILSVINSSVAYATRVARAARASAASSYDVAVHVESAASSCLSLAADSAAIYDDEHRWQMERACEYLSGRLP